MKRFEDRVVMITGAGSGIGEAAARRFAAEGAKVVLIGRTQEKLARVAESIDGETLVRVADVSDGDAMNRLVEEVIDHYGQLDVLVNNAGVAQFGRVHEADVDDWKKVMSINVDGVFYASRAALPELLKTKGSIVNVSSVSGLGGNWGMSMYNASKGAVSNLTRAMALDYGEAGVRVNAVCPGLTRSELTTGVMENETLMKGFADRTPQGRAAESEEVGDVIVFLASHDARFVNGVNLPVDGGLMASNGQPRMG
ncbi:meso-butanediol dehydrogenase / (S,S)-butanediol dehydrogenase / diacetyl reductase [Kushneria avicenniae]|uniref:Meso-butanediol dehydrogenase / (S,S)-butanediol dehydrogenase / diacetyl reductase n=1 Tax=Kushneria avicenniae TaxID=402385 RepID=A0A1I1MDZ7_9GAMM|nr:SDR family oxidoreductase [Kushneria avicenniae]SFC79860.1 meso-butanediol dehydrogenase / (S,S)-butanediol dehydrogenase / diacetyl reductase [Kushneria avicenniae]